LQYTFTDQRVRLHESPTDLQRTIQTASASARRADFGPNGIVRFAYGDGRLAATHTGRSAVFVALLDPGIR
jgi:hypothetical protein